MIRTNLIVAVLGSEREMSRNTHAFALLDNAQITSARYADTGKCTTNHKEDEYR
jgi:hypothetical protein